MLTKSGHIMVALLDNLATHPSRPVNMLSIRYIRLIYFGYILSNCVDTYLFSISAQEYVKPVVQIQRI